MTNGNTGPKRGGARLKVRSDDRRGGSRKKVRDDDQRGGKRKSAGRERSDTAMVTTLQISVDARDKLDDIVSARQQVQPTATRRQVVENMIAAAYAELDAMWQDMAEAAEEVDSGVV